MKLNRSLAVLLAGVLQLAPMLRGVISLEARALTPASWAWILKLGGGAVALLGGYDAVSGATAIVTPYTVNATVGTNYSRQLTTSGQTAHSWSASTAPKGTAVFPLTPGLWLTNSNGRIGGVPTWAGTSNITISAWENTGNSGASVSAAFVFNITNSSPKPTAPAITTQPLSQTNNVNTSASFSVTASGSTPLSYQWWFGSSAINNATNATYTIASVQTANAGSYTVVLTNIAGSVTSAPAVLTVQTPAVAPAITTQPKSQTNSVNTSVSFNVTASGTAPLRYQWRFGSSAINNATNATFTIGSVQTANAGSYTVVVTNLAGSITSAPATLTVVQAGPVMQGTNIGSSGTMGSFGMTNNVMTVRGSGAGITGTGDDFYFVHQPLQGDGMVVARITSMQPDNMQSGAGVMMRDGVTTGARHVFLGFDASTNMFLRRRLSASAASIDNARAQASVRWLRLTRSGNTFTASVSSNGTNWTCAWVTAMALPSQLEAGLAVTAARAGSMCTVQFDNLAVGASTPLPGTWPLSGPMIYQALDAATPAAMQALGGYPLVIGGAVGDQFSVKCSTNSAASFTSWQTLGTVTNTCGVVSFLDSQAPTNQMRFYRVQKVGP